MIGLNMVNVGLKVMIVIIQAMWAIDEYARIFVVGFNLVLLSPPTQQTVFLGEIS